MKGISNSLRRWMIILLLLPIICQVYGQVVVTGKITSAADGESLPGVNVLIKGTTKGSITDLDGNYSLEVENSESVLAFSSMGFASKEIQVGSQTSINVELESDISELDEIIVIGYGGIKNKELTGAVATVRSDDILKTTGSDINQALQGRLAGVSIQASSGAPGAQANIQIRGIGSFSAGSVNPLYVIDGIPYDGIPSITPEEIESIHIAKDGATAAVYGTRASNGVIQITTKRSKGGKLTVDYSNYYGIQNVTSGVALMNTQEQIHALEQRALNNGQAGGTEIFILNPNALEYNSDFQDYIITDNAPYQNHTLSLSGGKEDANLYAVTNYYAQDGVLKNSGYNSFSTRINSNLKKGKFSAATSLSAKMDTRESSPWGIYERSISQRPFTELPTEGDAAVIRDNPEFYGGFARMFSQRDIQNSNTINTSIDLKYEIIEGLTFQVRGGGSLYNYRRDFWKPRYLITNDEGEVNLNASQLDAHLTYQFQYKRNWMLEEILTYQKSFGLHNLTAFVGYSREGTIQNWISGEKSDFQSNETQQWNAANNMVAAGGYAQEHTLEGIISRVMYNYNEKYMFAASMRYDGSSNFGSENRRKAFWGGSAGWNIAEEGFFEGAKRYIDVLKLRASAAEVGNERVSPYLYSASIYSGSNYHWGAEGSEELAPGSTQRGYANPFIQWETNLSKNIGLDASLLEGKIGLTVDAYHNSKQDMLLPVDLAPSAGTWIPRSGNLYKPLTQNVGNMINKGIEFTATYNGQFSDFKWSAQAVFSKNVNNVTSLPDNLGLYSLGGGEPILYTNQVEKVSYLVPDEPIPTFMLIPTDGIIKNEEELAEYEAQWTSLPATPMVGDLRYIDTNGDSVSDALDRVPHGTPFPDFELGVNLNAEYKGFDLSVSLFYSYGGKVYNGVKALAYATGRHKDQYYQWTPSNPTSEVPAMRTGGYNHPNVSVYTDQFLEDGTYLRVRNITLGYTLPKKVLTKLQIDQIRVFVSAQNPFTFTKYTGFDPEVGYSTDASSNNGSGDALFSKGVDRGNYPIARKIETGLKINF